MSSVQKWSGEFIAHTEEFWDLEFMAVADHARIVAEALDETVACCRLAYEQGKAEIERAHAAALAEEYRRWRKAAEDVLASWPRTLTADDPEPAVGSVVLGRFEISGQRVMADDDETLIWRFSDGGWCYEWATVQRIYGPVNLIWNGDTDHAPSMFCRKGHKRTGLEVRCQVCVREGRARRAAIHDGEATPFVAVANPQHVGPCSGMGGPFGCNCNEDAAIDGEATP